MAFGLLEGGDDAPGILDLGGGGREDLVNGFDLGGMDGKLALETALFSGNRIASQTIGVTKLKVRRVQRQHPRCPCRHAHDISRILDFRVVLAALDPHVVGKVLGAEADSDDSRR